MRIGFKVHWNSRSDFGQDLGSRYGLRAFSWAGADCRGDPSLGLENGSGQMTTAGWAVAVHLLALLGADGASAPTPASLVTGISTGKILGRSFSA